MAADPSNGNGGKSPGLRKFLTGAAVFANGSACRIGPARKFATLPNVHGASTEMTKPD